VCWSLGFLLDSLVAFIHSFIHYIVCLTTGPQSLPKRVLHIVRYVPPLSIPTIVSSLRSSSSLLRLLYSLSFTSILLFTFPSVMCVRRQLLRKMWPIQLVTSFWLYAGYSCPPWLCIFFRFLQDLSNWSSVFFSNTTYENFICISYLFFWTAFFLQHRSGRKQRTVRESPLTKSAHAAQTLLKMDLWGQKHSRADYFVNKLNYIRVLCI
jgi:hypothetical protein